MYMGCMVRQFTYQVLFQGEIIVLRIVPCLIPRSTHYIYFFFGGAQDKAGINMSLSVVQSVFVFLSELMLAESLQLTVTPEDTPRKDCHTADLVSDKDFICIVCLCLFFAYFRANNPFL